MLDLSDSEKQILVAAQRGIAVAERPFAVLAEKYGVDESRVLALLNRLLANGEARRFGAVFDARRLGYRSALCFMDVPAERIDAVVAQITPLPGVTHFYRRGWAEELARDGAGGPGPNRWPALWFTLAAPADSFDDALNALRASCAPFAIRELPALRRFKIDVVFDMRSGRQADADDALRHGGEVAESDAVFTLTEEERRIVGYFEGHVPVVSDFYAQAARHLGLAQADLMRTLERWLAHGVVRRVALLLRHRAAGFKANGMCCWSVAEADMVAAGGRLAARREVTHCYERPLSPEFPFNLFAMIHTASWRETQSLFQSISSDCGLRDGQLLLSIREFKKTSMRFFG